MDGSDLPLTQGDRPILTSLVTYGSMEAQLHMTSGRNFTAVIGSDSLQERGVSLSGLEPPSASPQSTEQTGHVLNEVKVEEHKDSALNVANSPTNRGFQHARRGHWPHLDQLAGGLKHKGVLGDPLMKAKDKLMVSVRENSRKDDVNTWHLGHSKSKHVDETGRLCVSGMDEKNKSESALLPQDARLKILSASSFSQFFGKKTSKGKAVIHGQSGDNPQPVSSGTLQTNGWLSAIAGMPSGARVQISHHSHTSALDSTCVDVNLREWLVPGRCMKNKAEAYDIFCQVVELVNLAHSQGVVLQHLRPSYFVLLPSKRLKYTGSSAPIDVDIPTSMTKCKKRPPEEDINFLYTSDLKQRKIITDMKFQNHLTYDVSCSSATDDAEQRVSSIDSCQGSRTEKSLAANHQLEEKWYTCPDELDGRGSKSSSNIYSLGVMLFELFCSFGSLEAHSAAMFDMHHRILPPCFLSESPKEAGFCLWLIHPDPLSRPTIRDVLLSDLFSESQKLNSSGELTTVGNDDKLGESEVLLDFLVSLKEKQQGHATKLVQEINCIETDIKGLVGKLMSTSPIGHIRGECNLQNFMRSVARTGINEARLLNDMSQLEKAYFSTRSQATVTAAVGRADKDLLKNRESLSHKQKQIELVNTNQKSTCGLDTFFEGLCKFTCFSKFELRGTLRNGDLLNSANVICSLSFDRDEEYIAVAGASKRIKIFEYSALVNDTIEIHYPVIEMVNKSKLSCISWNSYIKNYLASTDYDGVVQVWDAGTGLGLSQYVEHQKRAWSVDFSRVDPTKFATGSDDCSVKLWCTNEKRSTCTIRSPANVCCVQFSPYSSHLLAFGSADHKIYTYDLRYTRVPWCSLAGHEKTVSYVKFVDPETLVSASTDNTLKLWDLSKTSLSAISPDSCNLTFTGHANKKHFVGLSVQDGYIACGSESNEVFTYYRSLPMPIASYKCNAIRPISQNEVVDDTGLFVSSVCWRSKSNMVLAANSGGSIRLLQMV